MLAGFNAGAISVAECRWIKQLFQKLLHIEIVLNIVKDIQSAIRNGMESEAEKQISLKYSLPRIKEKQRKRNCEMVYQ